MLIKSTKKAADLAPEGEYPTALRQVTYKNENKKCVLIFDVNHAGKVLPVPKDVPASFDSGPLRKDLEILNGVEFTRAQVDDGVEPERFIGRKCRALVVHKRTSGGKTVAIVNVLMPLVPAPVTHAPPPPGMSAAGQVTNVPPAAEAALSTAE